MGGIYSSLAPEAVMAIVCVGVDLAKNVFAIHGVDDVSKAVWVEPRRQRAPVAACIRQSAAGFRCGSTLTRIAFTPPVNSIPFSSSAQLRRNYSTATQQQGSGCNASWSMRFTRHIPSPRSPPSDASHRGKPETPDRATSRNWNHPL